MPSPEVRFRPPPLAPSADLRWVLRRSFGPGGSASPPEDADAAVHLAWRLDLAHRIAARNPAAALSAEIGLRPAGRLFARLETIRRRASSLAAAAEPIAAAAAAHGLSLVALKFLALRMEGVVPDGIRRAGDLDILVREADLARWTALLAELGYRNPGYPPTESATCLVRDSGHTVDLHRQLAGVCVAPGADSASLTALEDAGLLVPAAPSSVLLLRRDVLVAHLIVHGLSQHGWSAHGYPHLRMLADLADLGLGEATAGSAHRWIREHVTSVEMQAMTRLVTRLRDGDEGLLERSTSDEPDAILLRHFVACVFDREYGRALRLDALLRHRAGGRPLWRAATRALFLTDAQIDLIYGRPRHRCGYLAWRLYRPIDLVGRSVRYALATVRAFARSRQER